MAGFESPALRSREPLHSVWAGVTRTLGTARRKVAPTLAADVVLMVEACMARADLSKASAAGAQGACRPRRRCVVLCCAPSATAR